MTVVITCIPSPYQVELFDALARNQPDFKAIYLMRRDRNRSWRDPQLQHYAAFLDEDKNAHEMLLHAMDTANLVVFGDYTSRSIRDAMRRRDAINKPWCFWGERPGFHGLGALGRIRRHIQLSPLHRNRQAPIWGIGQWAVDAYKREFSENRLYCDVPYYSDLARFRVAGARRSATGALRILYSGSLTKRKGVDLLARAFRRLSQSHDNVNLSVIGSGPWRPAMERLLGPAASRTVFHNFVAWSDLPGLYADADVLCAPSRYDGWGLIVAEGMASGMPVIATDRMGAAIELVEPERNGWLVRAGDEASLLAAMRAAASSPASAVKAMGQAAQSIARSQDVAAGVRRFQAAVDETMNQWRHQAIAGRDHEGMVGDLPKSVAG